MSRPRTGKPPCILRSKPFSSARSRLCPRSLFSPSPYVILIGIDFADLRALPAAISCLDSTSSCAVLCAIEHASVPRKGAFESQQTRLHVRQSAHEDCHEARGSLCGGGELTDISRPTAHTPLRLDLRSLAFQKALQLPHLSVNIAFLTSDRLLFAPSLEDRQGSAVICVIDRAVRLARVTAGGEDATCQESTNQQIRLRRQVS